MVDEFQAVRFLEKKRTNSGPFMESTSKHSIYTLIALGVPGASPMAMAAKNAGAAVIASPRLLWKLLPP
jgi:hypothetical protein